MGAKEYKGYYSRVVGELLKYREYKQRLKVIQYELDSKLDTNSAINYDSPGVQTSNIFDSTFEAAIDRLESDLADEFREKFDIVNLIEFAIAGLSPIEEHVIREKYLSGRKKADVDIYKTHKFKYGKDKYYDIKDEAVEKIARILGYI
ncbi:ArpU family phage packaging/lysis transcriptional regulator [Natroniella sp. ANB-PHB2]|uniref:ArpU family phage packaging/lysis transcriptional regulator n=1 Tax=Natroniella sp. ANB-PHB2 TaxID=3384444 RepID=UPI0038D42379